MSESAKYRIMGIDPGTNYMGYGIIEVEGRSLRGVVMGEIDLHKLQDPYTKLRYIFERVGALIDQHSPREVALESPFFGENVQSMLKLGRAQGVAMAAALSRGLAVSEYAPMRIKQSITGRGSASKEQVASIVCRTLSIDAPAKRMDATDGMAVAMCHHFTTSSPLLAAIGGAQVKGLGGGKKAVSKRGSSSWESFVRENPAREIKLSAAITESTTSSITKPISATKLTSATKTKAATKPISATKTDLATKAISAKGSKKMTK